MLNTVNTVLDASATLGTFRKSSKIRDLVRWGALKIAYATVFVSKIRRKYEEYDNRFENVRSRIVNVYVRSNRSCAAHLPVDPGRIAGDSFRVQKRFGRKRVRAV